MNKNVERAVEAYREVVRAEAALERKQQSFQQALTVVAIDPTVTTDDHREYWEATQVINEEFFAKAAARAEKASL